MARITNLDEAKSTTKALFLSVPVTPHEKFGGMIVQHPFTSTGVVPNPNSDKMELMDIIESKENYIAWKNWWFEKIDGAKDIQTLYVYLNKPWRLTFLKFCRTCIDRDTFSDLLADAWVSSENPNMDANCSLEEIVRWFKRANKKILMDEKDYVIWNDLPSEFEVYRGVGRGRVSLGLSWTRNYKTAKWFADRWGYEGYVQKAVIKKENALAYLNTRGEDEIVVDIFSVKDIVIVDKGEDEAIHHREE